MESDLQSKEKSHHSYSTKRHLQLDNHRPGTTEE